ncbi:hypothetical protein D3C86_2260270 [compost metagenome]
MLLAPLVIGNAKLVAAYAGSRLPLLVKFRFCAGLVEATPSMLEFTTQVFAAVLV